MTCPECNSPEVIRSRRQSIIDYACSVVGLFPYRCSVCLYRFRHFGNTLSNPHAHAHDHDEAD